MKTHTIVAIIAIVILIALSAWYVTDHSSAGHSGQVDNNNSNGTTTDLSNNTSAVPADTVDFINSNGTRTTVYTEIASTEQEREQGLMNRTSMDEDHGMLFLFDYEARYSFWMKDTSLSLDIIFISGDDTIVDIYHNAKPEDETVFTSRSPCKYVVEVNGGFSERHDVHIGDKVKISYSERSGG